MRYISLFSGIEAATVAWESLGWDPVAFSEIDPFPCAVLAERFPDVPNLGDITKVDWSEYAGTVDIVVGGSPCQSFSVAGKREGLAGASGLMFEYIRAVREILPRYFLWENVPGALSSEGGRAFKQLLGKMDDIGYGLAWRVLDAQFFGVPQRRRRVFLVGCLGDPERACSVLFEPESMRWDNPASRGKRQELTATATRCSDGGNYCIQGDIAREAHLGQNGVGYSDDGVSYTPNTMDVPAVLAFDTTQITSPTTIVTTQFGDEIAGTLTARFDSSPCVDRGQNIICIADDTANAAIDVDLVDTLKCGGMPPSVTNEYTIRRLMPIECERLQGFPSVVELEFDDMTRDEIIACALASKDIEADVDSGKVYTHRGPGGMRLDEPREIGNTIANGYKVANLTANGQKKKVRINRVIYIAAYGAIPDGYVIDHINNDKSDNRISNLQAITPEDNSTKAKLDGCYLCGNDNPRSKIDVELKPVISHEYMDGNATYRELAQKYGISKSRVHQIVHEYDWTKIPYRGKPADECPDGPRYKALGNSMAVPVMRWIGERIDMFEND